MSTHCSPPWSIAVLGLLTTVVWGCGGEQAPAPPGPRDSRPVVVYSPFDDVLIQPVFDAYAASIGVQVTHVSGDGSSLVARLKEKTSSPAADLLILGDAGHLALAVDADVLRPVHSPILVQRVPDALRDPDDYWFGLTVRARPVVYDRRMTARPALADYASLGDAAFEGAVCLSASAQRDNLSLIARLIAQAGEREAEMTVRAWIGNLATAVFADDTALLEAIDAGHCQLGIADAGMLAGFVRRDPEFGVASFQPPAASGGTHADITGAGVTRHAANPAGALRLLEWLAGEEGQRHLRGVRSEMTLRAATEYGVSSLPVSHSAYLWKEAELLAERAHYP